MTDDAGLTPEKADAHAELQLEIDRRAKLRTITLPEGTWEDMADEFYSQGNDLHLMAARTTDEAAQERLSAYAKVVWVMADALRDPAEDTEEKN